MINLLAYRNLLMPALWATMDRVTDQKGNRAIEAELITNPTDQSIELGVRFKLFSTEELQDESFKKTFAGRVGDAIGLKYPQPAKSRRVERRQLHWRGEQSMRLIGRPARKAKKVA